MPALEYASWPCDNLSNINPFGFACILKCPNKKPQNIADIWLSSRVKTQVYSRPPGKQIPFDTSLLTLKPKWWKKLAATRSLKTMKIAKARLAAHRGKGKCKNVKKHPRYIILRRVQNILQSLFSGNGEKIYKDQSSFQFSINLKWTLWGAASFLEKMEDQNQSHGFISICLQVRLIFKKNCFEEKIFWAL